MRAVHAWQHHLARHPFLWMAVVGLLVVVVIVATSAALLTPVASIVLTVAVIALPAGLTVRYLRATQRELQHQLAERTDALSLALTQVQAESSRTRGMLDAVGAIIHSIVDSVIVTDRDGAILIANPAACQLIGLPAAEVVGAPIEVWLQRAPLATERDNVIGRLRAREQQTGLKLQWADQRVLSLSLAPVRLPPVRLPPDHKVIGLVVVCRDVTREAELDRLKNTFISMVSHELRTPLVGVLSQVEILTLGYDEALSAQQRGAVHRIAVNAEHLLRLINDLLDHAQIEAGQMLALHPTRCAPRQLVDEVLAITADTARGKHLQLTADLSDDVPDTLIADPQRLLQILLNLVGNAIKFTEQGGVHVRITRPDADHWALHVIDTGRGIPSDDQARLFEPFYRTGLHAGAGLGLSIVKHLVDLMGGEVQLISQIDHGTTVSVVLPLVEPAPDQPS